MTNINQTKLKITEHQIQSLFFEELFYKYKKIYPYIFAIPNGGKRHIGVAKKLKVEGVKAGVCDVFCAIPSNGMHGLFIEFKSATGKLSSLQAEFINTMQYNDYACIVCKGVDEAFKGLNKYLSKK